MRKSLLTALVIALCGCAPEGPSAFVDLNLALSSECEVTLEGDTKYVGRGRFDISRGAVAGSTYCQNDYIGRLRINSLLRSNSDRDQGRAEPNVLQIHRAEVTLKTQDGAVLAFGDPAFPNPFAQIVNVSLFPTTSQQPSVAELSVAMVPSQYDEFLADFAGDTIIAEVQIFGTTTGDVEVDFKPFPFPIQICDGCLTGCAVKTFADLDEDRDQVLDSICDDDSGQDGRVCFDPSC